jgi:hypothetical protein
MSQETRSFFRFADLDQRNGSRVLVASVSSLSAKPTHTLPVVIPTLEAMQDFLKGGVTD